MSLSCCSDRRLVNHFVTSHIALSCHVALIPRVTVTSAAPQRNTEKLRSTVHRAAAAAADDDDNDDDTGEGGE